MTPANMLIELTLTPDHVEIVFQNASAAPLRLWELDNFWGWWSVAFQIRSEQDPHVSMILHDWHREWTVNAPSTFVLAPGEKRIFPFNLNDGWWKRDQTVARLKDTALWIRVSYHAEPVGADVLRFLTDPNMPDGLRQHNERWAAEIASVFTGSVVSDWVPSQPPHPWLLAPLPYRGDTAARLLQYPPEEVLRRLCVLIDHGARQIEFDAKDINEDPVAPLTVLAKLKPPMTVGHLGNSILENAAEIQKAIGEARAYLKAKTVTQPEDGTDTPSQD